MRFVCPLIVVRDIQKSRDFYERVLGQEVRHDFGEDIAFEGGFSIHLEEHFLRLLDGGHNQVARKSNSFELYFESEDLDGVLCRLNEAGVEFIHEIREQPWGQRVMRFRDPDGHIIEVGEAMESVILRYYRAGLTVDEIATRTSMSREFVEACISRQLM